MGVQIFRYSTHEMEISLTDCMYALQKMKYEYHTKLPLESYQNRFLYDSSGTDFL